MLIKNCTIRNFRSIRDTAQIDLAPGINFIVGKNNSGKTALLRALSGRFDRATHRGLRKDSDSTSSSSISVCVEVTKTEFEACLDLRREYAIPYLYDRDLHLSEKYKNQNDVYRAVYDLIFEGGKALIRGEIHAESGSNDVRLSVYPSIGDWTYEGSYNSFTVRKENATAAISFGSTVGGKQDSAGTVLTRLFFEKVYMFGAQRAVSGKGKFSHEQKLNPDGSNLPQVLLSLQASISKYNRFNAFITEIFPEIRWVSVYTHAEGVEVRIWTVDLITERDDLAIPLEESGTGVGQALAIVYALLASESTVILIDEPTSFLHPSAARALMRIMASFSANHQLIISTHSPDVISLLRPDRVLLLRKIEQETHINVLRSDELRDIEAIVSEVGARLSDLFSADEILWVEGPTEEICFPMILRTLYPRAIERVTILSLYDAGGLEGRKATAEVIWGIYRKLTVPGTLMPRAVAFILDHEGRTEQKLEDLRKISQGYVRFLDRRMYENYLLKPSFIAMFMNELPSFSENKVSQQQIETWMMQNGANPRYIPKGANCAPLTDKWIRTVHAARVISDVVSELSNGQENYQKTKHSVRLTDIILHSFPQHFAELGEFLHKILLPESKQFSTSITV